MQNGIAIMKNYSKMLKKQTSSFGLFGLKLLHENK